MSSRQIASSMERRIIQNLLDVVILFELRKHSLSGYDVLSIVFSEFNALLSSSIIYGRLYDLERRGLIKGEFTFRKRVYVLTKRGEEATKELSISRDRIMLTITNIFAR